MYKIDTLNMLSVQWHNVVNLLGRQSGMDASSNVSVILYSICQQL